MPMIPVENLAKSGIVLDIPAHELPPEAVSGGNNIRFYENAIRKVGGYTAEPAPLSIVPYGLFHWKTGSDENRWIYCGTDKVYYTYNDTHYNITRYTTTPGDDDYTGGTRPLWTGGILHGVPILNHDNLGNDYPQQWDGATNRLKDLSNWPANVYAKVIRPFQNFLIALNLRESGTDYPYKIRWSSPADPGTVPTAWTAAATNLAGSHTIAQSGGHLVDCLPLMGQNILYKEDAIWAMRLSGNQYVFNFYELSNMIGALTQRCMIPFYNSHFVVGSDDIVIFDGTSPKSLVTNTVKKSFFNAVHGTNWKYTFVVPDYKFRELWICFCSAGNATAHCDRAMVWNWSTNTWSFRDLPDLTDAKNAYVARGTGITFDGATGTFDDADGTFDGSALSPASLTLFGASAGANAAASDLFVFEDGYQADGSNYESFVERTGLPIVGTDRQGNVKVDPLSVKFIRSFIPKIIAQIGTELEISVGMQDDLNGPVTWEGPYTYTVGTTVKIDTALSGKYLAWKCRALSNKAWALTGFKVDLDVISEL